MKYLVRIAILIPLTAQWPWCISETIPHPLIPTKAARKIGIKEGFFKKGTLPNQLHNPCSLSYAGQAHAVKGRRGFAAFDRDEMGWNACMLQIMRLRARKQHLNKLWPYMSKND